MSSSISNAALSISGASPSNRVDSSNVINIEGNKISWPDDGWYEVQSATSHNTMHEGGRSAEMPSGSYHVINHTTGERFKDIQIGPAATTATSPEPTNNSAIKVDGNKISWPDDGWYEVQSATSFNTMSEGGLSAEMPSGSYNIINHTTGERFKGIQIGPETTIATSPDRSNNGAVKVDGSKITWPDDGWYEVQSAESYNTVSEGGISATLPHGTYTVINHTTGEKYENVAVGSSGQTTGSASDQSHSGVSARLEAEGPSTSEAANGEPAYAEESEVDVPTDDDIRNQDDSIDPALEVKPGPALIGNIIKIGVDVYRESFDAWRENNPAEEPPMPRGPFAPETNSPGHPSNAPVPTPPIAPETNSPGHPSNAPVPTPPIAPETNSPGHPSNRPNAPRVDGNDLGSSDSDSTTGGRGSDSGPSVDNRPEDNGYGRP